MYNKYFMYLLYKENISNKNYNYFFKNIVKKDYKIKNELLNDIENFKENLANEKVSTLLPENLNLLQSIYNKFMRI